MTKLFLFYSVLIMIMGLSSCKESDEITPVIPSPPDPPEVVPPSSGNDTTQTPTAIVFPFTVTAEVSDYFQWQADDSIFATTVIDGQKLNLVLHVDSIDEKSKSAVFADTINFIPCDDVEWSFTFPSITCDFSIQDGSINNLRQFAEFTAKGSGPAPSLLMKSNIDVIQINLPAGSKTVECTNGFDTKIHLSEVSNANDSVYIAIPSSYSGSLVISAKNENGLVFRSKVLDTNRDVNNSEEYLFEVSIADKQSISLDIKKQYHTYKRGNFSGIAYLGDNSFALVDDDSLSVGEGWYPCNIIFDSENQIESVKFDYFVSSFLPNRDIEGITYCSSSNNLWLVGEKDNIVSEHLLTGQRTGKELDTSMFYGIRTNYGIEALSYNDITSLFWVTTEASLSKDGGAASPIRTKQRTNILRFQSYNEDCSIGGQWIYETDRHQKSSLGDLYSFGVPTICALDDGRLLVMERESRFEYVSDGEVAFCHEKLYLVDPSITPEGELLEKTLLLELPSLVTVSKEDKTVSGEFANYEGMCLGPRLEDGSQVLMLVSDSQGNLSISYSLDSEPYVFPDIFLPIVLHFD